MTINYINQRFPPPPYDEDFSKMEYYRALYDGDHELIFPRAQSLYDSDKLRDSFKMGRRMARYRLDQRERSALYHYVVVNLSAVIAELPADLINRSLGNISADTETDEELLTFIESVAKKSKVNRGIWSAVVQHQVDGLVAYRIRRNEKGEVWFEWKPGDMFLPHEDEMGADIAWVEERQQGQRKEKYLRVERQRLDMNALMVEQLVFTMKGETVDGHLDIKAYAEMFGLVIPDNLTLKDVNELLCGYVPNEETLLKPRGRSALRNADAIQEEINWTITRDSIVFEKHGKPKLAIPRALYESVAQSNSQRYGQRFVRNADLEVVSYDEKTGAVPLYITWDAQTEQSFDHVKRLIKQMMAVSKTSLQAVGLEDNGGNKSAIAILYEWIQSVIKAEAIKDKFDSALRDAIRKCIILENALGGKQYEVKEPVVEWGDMLPKAESERDEEEAMKYEKGVQSLETTIRNIHPDWSEEAIQAELQKIQDEQTVEGLNPTFVQPPKVKLGE